MGAHESGHNCSIFYRLTSAAHARVIPNVPIGIVPSDIRKLIKSFLPSPSPLNELDGCDWTPQSPLMTTVKDAPWTDVLPIVRMLVRAGADPDFRHCHTALDLARDRADGESWFGPMRRSSMSLGGQRVMLDEEEQRRADALVTYLESVTAEIVECSYSGSRDW